MNKKTLRKLIIPLVTTPIVISASLAFSDSFSKTETIKIKKNFLNVPDARTEVTNKSLLIAAKIIENVIKHLKSKTINKEEDPNEIVIKQVEYSKISLEFIKQVNFKKNLARKINGKLILKEFNNLKNTLDFGQIKKIHDWTANYFDIPLDDDYFKIEASECKEFKTQYNSNGILTFKDYDIYRLNDMFNIQFHKFFRIREFEIKLSDKITEYLENQLKKDQKLLKEKFEELSKSVEIKADALKNGLLLNERDFNTEKTFLFHGEIHNKNELPENDIITNAKGHLNKSSIKIIKNGLRTNKNGTEVKLILSIEYNNAKKNTEQIIQNLPPISKFRDELIKKYNDEKSEFVIKMRPNENSKFFQRDRDKNNVLDYDFDYQDLINKNIIKPYPKDYEDITNSPHPELKFIGASVEGNNSENNVNSVDVNYEFDLVMAQRDKGYTDLDGNKQSVKLEEKKICIARRIPFDIVNFEKVFKSLNVSPSPELGVQTLVRTIEKRFKNREIRNLNNYIGPLTINELYKAEIVENYRKYNFDTSSETITVPVVITNIFTKQTRTFDKIIEGFGKADLLKYLLKKDVKKDIDKAVNQCFDSITKQKGFTEKKLPSNWKIRNNLFELSVKKIKENSSDSTFDWKEKLIREEYEKVLISFISTASFLKEFQNQKLDWVAKQLKEKGIDPESVEKYKEILKKNKELLRRLEEAKSLKDIDKLFDLAKAIPKSLSAETIIKIFKYSKTIKKFLSYAEKGALISVSIFSFISGLLLLGIGIRSLKKSKITKKNLILSKKTIFTVSIGAAIVSLAISVYAMMQGLL